MNHETFMDNYNSYLAHKWVSSKDKAKAAEQKKREQEYNARYYREHMEKISARNRARQAGARTGEYLSGKQALYRLNAQQEEYAKANAPIQGPNAKLDDSSALKKMVSDVRLKQLMAQGMSKQEATNYLLNEAIALEKEYTDLAERNARMKETGLNQAEQQRASAMYNRQNDTLSRRSSSDTRASEAQAASRNPRRQQNTLNKRSSSDMKASEAQAQAAANRRSTALSNVQSATLARQSPSNARASEAQAQATRNRTAYQQSATAKINRAVSKGSKKVIDTINSVKATKQKVIDIYNNTTAKINKAKNTVQTTLNKYFG